MKMNTIKFPGLYFFIAACLIFYASCNGKNQFISPQGYDLNNPVKIYLESQLTKFPVLIIMQKIPVFLPSVMQPAHYIKFFLIKMRWFKNGSLERTQDYEDLQLYDSTFYILSSSGDIVSV